MGIRISKSYNEGTELLVAEETAAARGETFESQELFRRAQALVQKRNYGKAERLLVDALKIFPDNARYLSYYGLCVAMLGRRLEGEKLCTKAFKLDPSEPIICVNLGRIKLELGHRKEAHELFSRGYDLDNTQPAAALELSCMGVRRPPVVPFLPRSHRLNVFLGRLRHKILGLKPPGWK